MAARVASVSGKWSSTVTWGGSAVPVNADTFTINAGVIVEMDADESGFAAGLGASTINGTLYFSRSAGTYYLKMNGILTVSTTGTLDVSDGSGGVYPSNCTATILLNGNFSITIAGSGIVNTICGEPVTKYVKLTQNEAIAATVLHVDTDVSGIALWAGGLIRVDSADATSGTADSEERTISGTPTSNTITITAGLTAAKPSGSFILLMTRNVKILGINAAGSGNGTSGGTGCLIGAEIRLLSNGVRLGDNFIVNGTISNCGAAVSHGSNAGHTINAIISACTNGGINGSGDIYTSVISGCTTALNLILNGVYSGIINGCGTGIIGPMLLIGAVVKGCRSGITNGIGFRLLNCTFAANFRDLLSTGSAEIFNTLLGSATEFANYNTNARTLIDYVESLDHDQVSGAFRAWCRGGIVSSVASPVYDASRVRSYNAVCESATFPVFVQTQIVVPPSATVYVRCYIQKDSSMSYLPRLWIFPSSTEPLLVGSPIVETIMTNSINTWEILEAIVTNTTDSPQHYIVRTLSKNASGNVYFDPIIRLSAMLDPLSMQGGFAA